MSTTSPYKYDVCLSFAGEQRWYVEKVASQLRQREIKPFYDKYEQANLWGKDLYEHLDSVYRLQAKFCLLFISADYARKVWTSHERKSAQARAFEQSQEYILPIRFDDTAIPGVLSTAGYIDARETSPEQLASLVMEKLAPLDRSDDIGESAYIPDGVPTTPDEQSLLITTKPPAWEYLLFGGVLIQGKAKLAPKARDHQLRYAHPIHRVADDNAALEFIEDAVSHAEKLVSEGIMKIFDNSAQDWAFGPPGNVENIIHLGERFIRIYEGMYDWSARFRGTAAPPNFQQSFELAACLMDTPIKQVGQFIDQYAENLVGASERVNNGEEISIQITLKITIDEEVSEESSRELERVRRKLQR